MNLNPILNMKSIPLVAPASEGIDVVKQKREKAVYSINPETGLPYKTSDNNRKWNQENKDRRLIASKKWQCNNQEVIRKYYIDNRDKIGAYERAKSRDIKQRVIDAYGGCCVCCGETEFAFLTVDHVFGGGNQERKAGLCKIYRKLVKEDFPKDLYQLMCMNCNWAKGHYDGICPHQKQIENFCFGTIGV